MSNSIIPVAVTLLDKEYRVACPPHEREALLSAADFLNAKLKEVRDGGKVVGAERIAVITALNIANELLQSQAEKDAQIQAANARIRALNDKIDAMLTRGRQMEL